MGTVETVTYEGESLSRLLYRVADRMSVRALANPDVVVMAIVPWRHYKAFMDLFATHWHSDGSIFAALSTREWRYAGSGGEGIRILARLESPDDEAQHVADLLDSQRCAVELLTAPKLGSLHLLGRAAEIVGDHVVHAAVHAAELLLVQEDRLPGTERATLPPAWWSRCVEGMEGCACIGCRARLALAGRADTRAAGGGR